MNKNWWKEQEKVVEEENKGGRRKNGNQDKEDNHKEENMGEKATDIENSIFEAIRMGEGRHKRRKMGRNIKFVNKRERE